jgi:hypothetical protein
MRTDMHYAIISSAVCKESREINHENNENIDCDNYLWQGFPTGGATPPKGQGGFLRELTKMLAVQL